MNPTVFDVDGPTPGYSSALPVKLHVGDKEDEVLLDKGAAVYFIDLVLLRH